MIRPRVVTSSPFLFEKVPALTPEWAIAGTLIGIG
jgi:hypothetical protein